MSENGIQIRIDGLEEQSLLFMGCRKLESCIRKTFNDEFDSDYYYAILWPNFVKDLGIFERYEKYMEYVKNQYCDDNDEMKYLWSNRDGWEIFCDGHWQGRYAEELDFTTSNGKMIKLTFFCPRNLGVPREEYFSFMSHDTESIEIDVACGKIVFVTPYKRETRCVLYLPPKIETLPQQPTPAQTERKKRGPKGPSRADFSFFEWMLNTKGDGKWDSAMRQKWEAEARRRGRLKGKDADEIYKRWKADIKLAETYKDKIDHPENYSTN